MADYDDSVLPMPLQQTRFILLERLLKRLDSLSQHTIIMLTDLNPADTLPFLQITLAYLVMAGSLQSLKTTNVN
ncbi:hypothetical protein PKHYL_26520 [Psychrobacter sp. KH172YL61]|uniref:hypothetical protein n=1 Tax=Psychrobacter sp. KH172YL61 TaxID=2517899 RepID=UPI0010B2A1A8|nr:hypothetical protein [Psychrobacter sp. KH172YL61]BBI68461.1 hypothetical protein PKHYL_26520 [Psychrobacter sp. KH172YL61]